METSGKEIEGGLTLRAALSTIVTILLVVPINLYAFLVLGTQMGTIVVFFITTLITELSRMLGETFNRNEIFLVYCSVFWAGAAPGIIIYTTIFRSYFVNSPFGTAYHLNGVPLRDIVPSWLVPKFGSQSHILRTFLHPDWALPLAVWIAWILLTLIADIALGVIASNIYVQKAKLPFPLAEVDIATTEFLAGGAKSFHLISKSFIVGVLFGALVFFPMLIGMPLIPIPFWDATHLVQYIFPGGIFAVSTLLSTYFSGILIPLSTTAYMFMSSVVVWVVLNSLFVTTFPDVFPNWAQEYSQGMGYVAIFNRSSLRLWFSPQLGFLFGVVLYLVLRNRKVFATLFSRVRSEEIEINLPGTLKMFLLFIITSGTSVVLYHVFVPSIPIWIPLVYSLGVSLVISLSITATLGEGISIPGISAYQSAWPVMIYFAPYQGYAGYKYAPINAGASSAPFCRQVKAALTIGTEPRDLIKIWILSSVISLSVALLALDMFWLMAPIPSNVYPASLYIFLQAGFLDALIVTRQLEVTPNKVLIPMLIFFAILIIGEYMSNSLGKPQWFSGMGIFAGLFLPPTGTFSLLVGSILGAKLLPRFFGGKERWKEVRGYVVSGEFFGEGMIVILTMAFSLIGKSSWLLPW